VTFFAYPNGRTGRISSEESIPAGPGAQGREKKKKPPGACSSGPMNRGKEKGGEAVLISIGTRSGGPAQLRAGCRKGGGGKGKERMQHGKSTPTHHLFQLKGHREEPRGGEEKKKKKRMSRSSPLTLISFSSSFCAKKSWSRRGKRGEGRYLSLCVSAAELVKREKGREKRV